MQILFNGEPRQIEPGTTISRLLEDLKLDARRVAVEVNLDLVPRQRHAEYQLQADDALEVVTLVGGG